MEKFVLFRENLPANAHVAPESSPCGVLQKRLTPCNWGEINPVVFFDKDGSVTLTPETAIIGVVWEPSPAGGRHWYDAPGSTERAIPVLEAALHTLSDPADTWYVLLHNGTSRLLHLEQKGLFPAEPQAQFEYYRKMGREPYTLFCGALDALGTAAASAALQRLRQWFLEPEIPALEILVEQLARSISGANVVIERRQWQRLERITGRTDLLEVVEGRFEAADRQDLSSLCQIMTEEVFQNL